MCINFFKHHSCREGGQKEADVEKYGKPIENVFTSPLPLDSPLLCSMWNLPRARDQICVPCIGGWILNRWTTRKALTSIYVAPSLPQALC